MAESTTTLKDSKIAVVGSGLIGRSWAMLFASGGYKVTLYDVLPEQVSGALKEIDVQLERLTAQGLLRGSLSAKQQRERITGTDNLEECVKDAYYIQECVPEQKELKRKVWEGIDKLLTGNTIMASSTSAIMPSLISDHLTHRSNFIVVHPTNPPFFAPATEVVPAPWTEARVMAETKALLETIGQVPIMLKKEVDGFVLNRVQYAILGEGWRLIKEGVVSVVDFDRIMSCGLGVRYAFMGPFETAYLNADGMESYCERYADMIYRVQKSFGPPERMEGPLVSQLDQELAQLTGPVSEIQRRRQWRDRRLAALAKLKKDLNKQD